MPPVVSPVSGALRQQQPRSHRWSIARVGLYGFLISVAVFFLLPLYVMLTTSFKSMDEIRQGGIFLLPLHLDASSWIQAWTSACTGVNCDGLQVGFFNSVKIVIPSTIISVFLGALNGYALSFWRPRGAGLLFGILMGGAFIPVQVMIYPLVKILAYIGIFSSLYGIVLVHVAFSMPIMTLLFFSYYKGIPRELFNAARIDGIGFWRMFVHVMLPMAKPMLVVAGIMQITGIWNDYILGLIFAGSDNLPMTVQLNNIINTTTGERLYNLNMAATMITSSIPLLVYFVSGRWFVKGIAAGAVKG
ncbi:carbohydrate ABC transporter permease [Undibacterium sp. MH2W]|uniref:carbohydrate ABC transporter permease n=1 Tax=Undibacterium sp. MH2W TaxID=3413044 RepID=UPI003BF0DD35